MDASRRLDIASLFPLPGMGVGMNVSDMASYSHYPPHYSYQVSGCASHHSYSMRRKTTDHLKTHICHSKSIQGASPLQQHDQYAAHQHMALHNVSASDMGANQTIGSIGSAIPPIPTQQSHYATPNLGSAVSSSMHLTNSSHDSDVLGATSNYKTEHDMMYYSVWMRETLTRYYQLKLLD